MSSQSRRVRRSSRRATKSKRGILGAWFEREEFGLSIQRREVLFFFRRVACVRVHANSGRRIAAGRSEKRETRVRETRRRSKRSEPLALARSWTELNKSDLRPTDARLSGRYKRRRGCRRGSDLGCTRRDRIEFRATCSTWRRQRDIYRFCRRLGIHFERATFIYQRNIYTEFTMFSVPKFLTAFMRVFLDFLISYWVMDRICIKKEIIFLF